MPASDGSDQLIQLTLGTQCKILSTWSSRGARKSERRGESRNSSEELRPVCGGEELVRLGGRQNSAVRVLHQEVRLQGQALRGAHTQVSQLDGQKWE